MELLIHVNKRVKCRNEVQLPVETLLQLYRDPKANSFIIVSNICIVKILSFQYRVIFCIIAKIFVWYFFFVHKLNICKFENCFE